MEVSADVELGAGLERDDCRVEVYIFTKDGAMNGL